MLAAMMRSFLAALVLGLVLWPAAPLLAQPTLLNVSYDPTRELWRDLNAAFIAKYPTEAKSKVAIKQSHGGSSSQARAVIDGLEADVVTLALWSDTDAIRKGGLIDRATGRSGCPTARCRTTRRSCSSSARATRRASRTGRTWCKPGVEVITPNPKTSGNGKLSFLAAWGVGRAARRLATRTPREFVTELYRQVPVLDSGARGATTTFAQKKIGDVHLTWENEAHLEVRGGEGRAGDRLSADQHPRRAARGRGRCQRRPQGDAGGRRGVPEVPLHRRGAGDHRQALLPPDQRRGPREARGDASRASSCSRSTEIGQGLGRRARKQLLRRRRRVRPRSTKRAEVAGRPASARRDSRSRAYHALTSARASCPGSRSAWVHAVLPRPAGARPLAAAGQGVARCLGEFWAAVWTERARAAYRFTFGASFAAAVASVRLGLLVAWVLVRYEFPVQAAVRRAGRSAVRAADRRGGAGLLEPVRRRTAGWGSSWCRWASRGPTRGWASCWC